MSQQQIGVLFVCLGNICRSPMAEGVMLQKLVQRKLEDHFNVDSASTAGYHQGEPADRRTLQVLSRVGAPVPSRSRRVVDQDFEAFDWIFAMDTANYRDLQARAPSHCRAQIHKLLEPCGGGDVPDPYYGGVDGFDQVYGLVDDAIEQWLQHMGFE